MLTNDRICDWTECPSCSAENATLGGGHGYADRYFNFGGTLWAVCAVHSVRWAVTREMMGAMTVPDHCAELLRAIRVVEPAVLRNGMVR
jgi:hypothetical protein